MAFVDTLLALSLQKKLLAAAAVGAVVIGFTFLIQTASKPPMALLYSGVDTAAAGEVVGRLDAEGVRYEVNDGRIYVEAPARDRLRLTLARDGLPKQTTTGYELLDGMSGFSTTSEMFSAAYWRAKEGELARTILAIPGVTSVRVHIGADERSPFTRMQSPRTASVTVSAPGGLSSAQVKAIQHVTALSISNLQPDKVVVADTTLGILTSTETDQAMSSMMDEDRRASAMEEDLLRLIEARAGRGAARVSVSLQINRQREEITETSVDPNTAVAMNRIRSESKESEKSADEPVTIASDLPDGDAAGNERETERTESREETRFAVTTTDRKSETLPGNIERITVAVLLDHLPAPEGEEGTIPRSAEEITALRALIENAIGIDPARGDRVTIQSLAFDIPEPVGSEPAPATAGIAGLEPKLWQLAQIGIVSVVTLILGLFVVKPILTQGSSPSTALDTMTAELSPINDPLLMLRQASAEEPDAAAALLSAWLEEEEAA